MGTASALATIADEVRACTRCRLSERRILAVPGEGSPATDVLLVGEGPGAREDATGRPFVGPAGALLDELLASIGWGRPEVFITNVVKCRPPGNRDPEPAEIGACSTYLDRQALALDPSVVVTLGRHSLQRFLPGERIGAVHGSLRHGRGRWVFPMYHPAAALHQASLRDTLFRDVRGLPAALLQAREAIDAERAASVQHDMQPRDPRTASPGGPQDGAPPDDEQQLTLF